MSQLDIVIVGATGYTGRIACSYLHGLKSKMTWGIAARNADKLHALKQELNEPSLPSFVVDITNPESLDVMCGQARCVISCAGPFGEVGMPIVDACVRNAVHYVDSTGEFNFVRQVIEKYDAVARARGIALVPCCGWDCVPSDMGNYLVHREAKRHNVLRVEAFFDIVAAGISSGTAHSLDSLANHIASEDYSATSLVPKDGVQPTSAPTRFGLWLNTKNMRWTAPYIMAASNERIVRRSNALLKSSASYVEATEGTFLHALAAFLAFYAMGVLMALRPVRRFLLNRFFPSDIAHGPSAAKKSGARYSARFVGSTASGSTVEVSLTGAMDMYDITGVLLVECALCARVLSDRQQLKSGVLTPSVAFGDELVTRAENAGMSISITAVSSQGKKAA